MAADPSGEAYKLPLFRQDPVRIRAAVVDAMLALTGVPLPDVGFRYVPSPVPDAKAAQITDQAWWERDWTTAAAARLTYAELMGADPANIQVEGPDGGPYTISFVSRPTRLGSTRPGG